MLQRNATRLSPRLIRSEAVPHKETLPRIEELLATDFSSSFATSAPAYELYVAAPITGIAESDLATHHNAVSAVVESLRLHVNSLYWPGQAIRGPQDLTAPDIATEDNFKALGHCTAFIYLQFADEVRRSSALVALGCALAKRLKTTIVLLDGINYPFMQLRTRCEPSDRGGRRPSRRSLLGAAREWIGARWGAVVEDRALHPQHLAQGAASTPNASN